MHKTRVVKFIEDKTATNAISLISALRMSTTRVNCSRTNTSINIKAPVHSMRVNHDKIRQVNNLVNSTGKDYVIVNGGTDTGMKGSKTSLVLEHTDRNASVTGFDDRDMHHDLPIGTTATKVVDSDGHAVTSRTL